MMKKAWLVRRSYADGDGESDDKGEWQIHFTEPARWMGEVKEIVYMEVDPDPSPPK